MTMAIHTSCINLFLPSHHLVGENHVTRSPPTRLSISATRCSVASGARQSGQFRFWWSNHPSKHSLWNTWRHANLRTWSPSLSPHRHTTQSDDPPSLPLNVKTRCTLSCSASKTRPDRPEPTAPNGPTPTPIKTPPPPLDLEIPMAWRRQKRRDLR